MPKLSELTAKATPTTADEVAITDKADSDNTKRATLGTLPVSVPQQSALDLKAPLASPTFTGTVTVPTLSASVEVQVPDGSTSNPTLTNASDTDTGFYFPAANEIGCTVGGSLAWKTDSSGNLGVGTSSPTRTVHLHGSSSQLIKFTTDLSGDLASDGCDIGIAAGTNDLLLQNRENASVVMFTNNTERVRIDSNGRVGIGTDSPSTTLEVKGPLGAQFRITRDTTDDNYSEITGGSSSMRFKSKSSTHSYFSWTSEDSSTAEERMRIDSSGNLLVGKQSSAANVQGCILGGSGVASFTSDGARALFLRRNTSDGEIAAFDIAGVRQGDISGVSGNLVMNANSELVLETGSTIAMRIDSSQNLLVGDTTFDSSSPGHGFTPGGQAYHATSTATALILNRQSTDGTIVSLEQSSIQEGSISVSGTTVSYNGAHLSRWSQTLDGSRPEILRGTVLTNLDEMCEWAYPEQLEVLWAAGDGLPEGVSVGDVKTEAIPEVLDEEGNVTQEAVEATYWGESDGLPEGVSIGDVKTPYKAAGVEDNEQLNRMAVSSVEGDKNVAGVFQGWDDDDETYQNDFYCAMTGDFVIRIAQGTTVKRGDLLVSAGDGTAKPLSEDTPITVGVHASIVAKVTSTHISETYEDGSYLVPCVLMAC